MGLRINLLRSARGWLYSMKWPVEPAPCGWLPVNNYNGFRSPSTKSFVLCRSLAYTDRSHFKDQRSIGWNRPLTLSAICQRRRDNNNTCAALFDAHQSLIKAFNHLSLTKRDAQRLSLAIIGAIKLRARFL